MVAEAQMRSRGFMVESDYHFEEDVSCSLIFGNFLPLQAQVAQVEKRLCISLISQPPQYL